jgi:hypothetical protein
MCGGSVTLSTDDWLQGEYWSNNPNWAYSLYAFAYFPEGKTTVTTTKTVRAVTDGSFNFGDLQVNLYFADDPNEAGWVDAVSGDHPSVPQWNDGSPVSVQQVREVSVPAAGWYRVQTNAKYTTGYISAGYEVNLSYAASAPCEKDKLELACVCNPPLMTERRRRKPIR